MPASAMSSWVCRPHSAGLALSRRRAPERERWSGGGCDTESWTISSRAADRGGAVRWLEQARLVTVRGLGRLHRALAQERSGLCRGHELDEVAREIGLFRDGQQADADMAVFHELARQRPDI